MYRSNSFMEYNTILSILVTGDPEGDLSLRQLLSAETLMPRNAATVFAEATALLKRELCPSL
jgi:hypothetical protein